MNFAWHQSSGRLKRNSVRPLVGPLMRRMVSGEVAENKEVAPLPPAAIWRQFARRAPSDVISIQEHAPASVSAVSSRRVVAGASGHRAAAPGSARRGERGPRIAGPWAGADLGERRLRIARVATGRVWGEWGETVTQVSFRPSPRAPTFIRAPAQNSAIYPETAPPVEGSSRLILCSHTIQQACLS